MSSLLGKSLGGLIVPAAGITYCTITHVNQDGPPSGLVLITFSENVDLFADWITTFQVSGNGGASWLDPLDGSSTPTPNIIYLNYEETIYYPEYIWRMLTVSGAEIGTVSGHPILAPQSGSVEA